MGTRIGISLAGQTLAGREEGQGKREKTTGLDKTIQFSCNAARILAAPIRLQRGYESYYYHVKTSSSNMVAMIQLRKPMMMMPRLYLAVNNAQQLSLGYSSVWLA